MKFISLAVAALLGMVTVTNEGVQAVKVGEEINMNKMMKTKKGHNMISIGLTQTKYTNDRYQEYIKPLSKESNIAISEALNIPTTIGKDGSVSLVQNKRHVVDVAMENLENMGYEGSFWFGSPSQELQVIFDTGSAWAWVFSETCGAENKQCPARNKKFLQSQSKNFKMNKKGGQMLQYGKGAILGHPSEDKGCFAKEDSSCMSKFNFLTVVRGKDLESLKGSGLIGIAPTPAKGKDLTDPFNNGVAGFIAQLKTSADFNKEFDQVFSIYLSNDSKSPGDISFGGYDLDKFAKKGKNLLWVDQSANEAYWAVNTKSASFGDSNLAQYNQQVIFDNGMSLAMMPEKSFVPMLKKLHDLGFKCQETMPVWSCEGKKEQYDTLPPITLNLILNSQGQTANVVMPKEAYLKFDPDQNIFFLLISPW